MNNMTSKVSCFARAFHFRNNKTHIFNDEAAERILGRDYSEIAENMACGIKFFAPEFNGTKEQALRFIADNQLSPSVLGRSAFCESHLSNEIRLGCRQYVIFASGYDTYSLRNRENIHVYELDLPEVIADKQKRIKESRLSAKTETTAVACDLSKSEWKNELKKNGFDCTGKSFGSLLGISYYLSRQEFKELLCGISGLWSDGSAICFDFPAENDGEQSRKNRELAQAANEQMKARYTYSEIEELLSECGFLIYEHLDENMMTEQYFTAYNNANPNNCMFAPKGVQYILAVKKHGGM